MTLESREARQYDAMRLEKVDEKEVDGVNYEVYKKLVTKNNGELKDFVEVEVPATLKDAAKLEDEDEMINRIQKAILDEEAAAHRRTMVTEEEKEQVIEKTQEQLKEKIERLKNATDMTEEEIKEML